MLEHWVTSSTVLSRAHLQPATCLVPCTDFGQLLPSEAVAGHALILICQKGTYRLVSDAAWHLAVAVDSQH